MSDSVFDVNEIAKVLRGSMNETPWAKEGAAAIVAWFDSRMEAEHLWSTLAGEPLYRIVVQPEDQK